MSLDTQIVDMQKVWRSRQWGNSDEMKLVGRILMWNANVVEEFAESQMLSSHEYLMRLTVAGLWEARPKCAVLAGYYPASPIIPICRMYLLSVEPIRWKRFCNTIDSLPGYMNTLDDFVAGPVNVLTVWWEYPCTMVALWPPPIEDDPTLDENDGLRIPDEEHSEFVFSGKKLPLDQSVF